MHGVGVETPLRDPFSYAGGILSLRDLALVAGLIGFAGVTSGAGGHATTTVAGVGRLQRSKANQNKFFIGYRKHLIVCPSPKEPVVLFSIILPNDTADVKVMLPLIEMMKKIESLKVEYLVAGLGYFDAEDQKEALLRHDVAVVTGIKKNTIIP